MDTRLLSRERINLDVSHLLGIWFHSHEEDREGRVVYRGRSYEFPRARSPRHSLTIEPDGIVYFGAPGTSDGVATTGGSWEVTGNRLILAGPGRHEIFEIELLDNEYLRLRQLTNQEVTNGKT